MGIALNTSISANGQAALAELNGRHGDYRMVLMDCQMPGLDGFETTRRLRDGEAAQGLKRRPVPALTANALEGDRQRWSLAAGMGVHLAKRFGLAELRATLQRWLASSEA